MVEGHDRVQQPDEHAERNNQRLADRLEDLSHFIEHLTWDGQGESMRSSLARTAGVMREASETLAAIAHRTARLAPLSQPVETQSPSGPDARQESTERPKTTEKTRVDFAGRIAHPPRFELSRKNRVHMLRFSVVEHAGEEKRYHKVIAFDELADRWNGKLEKDEFVHIIGYPHVRQGRARDGTPKEFPEVYAAAIRKR